MSFNTPTILILIAFLATLAFMFFRKKGKSTEIKHISEDSLSSKPIQEDGYLQNPENIANIEDAEEVDSVNNTPIHEIPEQPELSKTTAPSFDESPIVHEAVLDTVGSVTKKPLEKIKPADDALLTVNKELKGVDEGANQEVKDDIEAVKEVDSDNVATNDNLIVPIKEIKDSAPSTTVQKVDLYTAEDQSLKSKNFTGYALHMKTGVDNTDNSSVYGINNNSKLEDVLSFTSLSGNSLNTSVFTPSSTESNIDEVLEQPETLTSVTSALADIETPASANIENIEIVDDAQKADVDDPENESKSVVASDLALNNSNLNNLSPSSLSSNGSNSNSLLSSAGSLANETIDSSDSSATRQQSSEEEITNDSVKESIILVNDLPDNTLKIEDDSQQIDEEAIPNETTKIESESETSVTQTPVISDVTVDDNGMEAFEFVKHLDNSKITLDLAQQYLEVGEYDSAKRLVKEVISGDGSEAQKAAAQDILNRLY